jgi:plasmid maintenance system antidote protein VapI
MTKKDKADAYFLRLNGCSVEEIAQRFGVSKQRISQILPRFDRSFQKTRNSDRCIYPVIKKYLLDNRLTYRRFAIICGLHPNSLYRNLVGDCDFSKRTIDKILAVTGMTYEQAFSTEVSI